MSVPPEPIPQPPAAPPAALVPPPPVPNEAAFLKSLSPAQPDVAAAVTAEASGWRVAKEQQRLDLELTSISQDIRQRRLYAGKLYRLICWWLFTVLTLVVWVGQPQGQFRLSDTVVVTLLGSTTATVIALFAIVARYLFPRHDSGDKGDDAANAEGADDRASK